MTIEHLLLDILLICLVVLSGVFHFSVLKGWGDMYVMLWQVDGEGRMAKTYVYPIQTHCDMKQSLHI